MRMNARAVLVLSLCIISSTLFSQDKKFTGYMVTLQGDTVRGSFPSYNEWSNNPSSIDFIAGNGERTLLTPANCGAFEIDQQDHYISFTGNRLENPIDDYEIINSKGSNAEDRLQPISSFLRLVKNTTGYQLYIYSDNQRINFFGRKPGGELMELRYKKYYDQETIREMADYRQQLLALFEETIKEKHLEGSLRSLSYREASMAGFIGKLFPGTNKDVKKEGSINSWVIMGGASFNKVELKAESYFNAISREYNASVSPLLSIGYIFSIDRNFGKYFFFPKLKLFRYASSGSMQNQTSIKTTTFHSDLVAGIEFNPGINIINKENFRWHVSAGMGLLALLNNRQNDERYYFSDKNTKYEEIKMSGATYSINVATGFTLNKKWMAIASYQAGTPLASFTGYRPHLSNVQVVVGYAIGKRNTEN